MHWGNPGLLSLLLLIPLYMVFIWVSARLRVKYFQRFADKRFYNYFLQEFSSFHWNLKNVILLVALFFMIVAAARPQWGKEMTIMKKEGLDIVVCIDVSKSMDAQDIKPSRIDRAKDQIARFVDQLKSDRVALVAFAGRAYVQCPLTDDYGALRMYLELLDTNAVSVYGTDIGKALTTANELFEQSHKYKVIVLISDGEDLEENAIDVAEELAKQGVVIYTLGVGSQQGSPIMLTDKNGNREYAKDDEGNIIQTKMDVRTLSQVAQVAHGRFYPVTPRQSEITEILKEIEQMEKRKFDSKEFEKYQDRYQYFVFAVIVLLIIEALIIARRKVKWVRNPEEVSR